MEPPAATHGYVTVQLLWSARYVRLGAPTASEYGALTRRADAPIASLSTSIMARLLLLWDSWNDQVQQRVLMIEDSFMTFDDVPLARHP
jgi:hypothetical protein